MTSPEILDLFGNPSSLHQEGQKIKRYMTKAWQTIYACLEVPEGTLGVLTGGGTASDNLAVLGVMRRLKQDAGLTGEPFKRHVIVTSAFEHPAVLEAAQHLATHEGYHHAMLPVTSEGFVLPETLEACLQRYEGQVGLVSVMHAHNEVGSIQPIAQLSHLAHQYGALFHTDAVQTVGKLKVSMEALGVDYLSFSGHKLYGPKGTGVLLIHPNAPRPLPLTFGGGQQHALRPGTENTLGLLGLSTALQYCDEHLASHKAHLRHLAQVLHTAVLQELSPWATLHGTDDFTYRLPGHLNYAFTYGDAMNRRPIEGESMVLKLALKGIAVSSGSACHSSALAPSDALLAMGVPMVQAQSSLRFSLGIENTLEEIPLVVATLRRILEKHVL